MHVVIFVQKLKLFKNYKRGRDIENKSLRDIENGLKSLTNLVTLHLRIK